MKRLGFDLILLGDPTAGKDTQAANLMRKYALEPVETGKQWRLMVKKNDFRARWLKRTFGKGHPAPVAIVKWFLNNKLKNVSKNKDLIFIGNPRLKPEAQFLVKLLKKKRRDFFVLYLKIPEKEIYRRSYRKRTGRMTQENQEQFIRNVINYTKKQVSKTVAYFSSMRKLKFVDSMPPIPKVSANIEKILHDYQRSARN